MEFGGAPSLSETFALKTSLVVTNATWKMRLCVPLGAYIAVKTFSVDHFYLEIFCGVVIDARNGVIGWPPPLVPPSLTTPKTENPCGEHYHCCALKIDEQ